MEPIQWLKARGWKDRSESVWTQGEPLGGPGPQGVWLKEVQGSWRAFTWVPFTLRDLAGTARFDSGLFAHPREALEESRRQIAQLPAAVDAEIERKREGIAKLLREFESLDNEPGT